MVIFWAAWDVTAIVAIAKVVKNLIIGRFLSAKSKQTNQGAKFHLGGYPDKNFQKLLLDQISGSQIVQAVSDFNHAIGNRFIVGSSISGVHSVSLHCFAQGFESRILVMEKLDEHMF